MYSSVGSSSMYRSHIGSLKQTVLYWKATSTTTVQYGAVVLYQCHGIVLHVKVCTVQYFLFCMKPEIKKLSTDDFRWTTQSKPSSNDGMKAEGRVWCDSTFCVILRYVWRQHLTVERVASLDSGDDNRENNF